MALLPQEPKQQKALGGIIAGVAVAALFWNFWATPKAEEIFTLEERVENLEDRNQNARIQAARGEEGLEENLATFERHIRRLEQLVPRAQEVPTLLVDMTTEAERLDIEPINFTPNPEEPGIAYNRVTYDVSWVGEYHAMGQFLASIASLSRIITPIGLQLEPYTGNDYPQYVAPVLATFTIETYILPTGGPAAQASAGAEGGA